MKASTVRHIQYLESKCARLAVKVNQYERLLAKLRPIVSEIEAIENGSASPLGDNAEYVLNEWLIDTVKNHCVHCAIDATDYIGAYSVYLDRIVRDLSETKEDFASAVTQLSVWKS